MTNPEIKPEEKVKNGGWALFVLIIVVAIGLLTVVKLWIG